MIIAFSGWRDWTDRDFVNEIVDQLVQHNFGHVTVIRVGDYPSGVDYFIRTRLEELGLPYERYDANWDNFGRAAGPVRNRHMLSGFGRGDELADLLIALPEPHTNPHPGSGTWGCVGMAWDLGVDTFLPKYKKGERE